MRILLVGLLVLGSLSSIASDCLIRVAPSDITKDLQIVSFINELGYDIEYTDKNANLTVDINITNTQLNDDGSIRSTKAECTTRFLLNDGSEKMSYKARGYLDSIEAQCHTSTLHVISHLEVCE